jgi:hypothetical protein
VTDDEIKNLIQASATEIRPTINDASADLCRHIAISGAATVHELQMVNELVLKCRDEVREMGIALAETLARTAAETQAMLKLPHRG